MFFTRCSPWSSKLAATLPRTAPRTASEIVMPPGSASPSRRAAMFTPSPYTVPSAFSITSPRWTPMRNFMRRSSGTSAPSALKFDLGGQRRRHRAGGRVEDGQHRVAGHVDDAALMDFDLARNTARAASRAATVERSSLRHQARVPRRVRRQDRRQSMLEVRIGHRVRLPSRMPIDTTSSFGSRLTSPQRPAGLAPDHSMLILRRLFSSR